MSSKEDHLREAENVRRMLRGGDRNTEADGTGPGSKVTGIKVLVCRGTGRHVAVVDEAEMARWARLEVRHTQIS